MSCSSNRRAKDCESPVWRAERRRQRPSWALWPLGLACLASLGCANPCQQLCDQWFDYLDTTCSVSSQEGEQLRCRNDYTNAGLGGFDGTEDCSALEEPRRSACQEVAACAEAATWLSDAGAAGDPRCCPGEAGFPCPSDLD